MRVSLPAPRAALACAVALGCVCGAAAPAAAATLSGVPPMPAAPPLAFGDTGAAVGLLQRDLAALGEQTLPFSQGRFGAATWVAVTTLQRRSGLRATGDMDAATWRALHLAMGARPLGSVPLGEWDQGTAVRQLQGDLAQLGLAPGPIDGVIGPRTMRALQGFQRRSGLPASGVLDAATAAALGQGLGAPAGATASAPVHGPATVSFSTGATAVSKGPTASATPVGSTASGLPIMAYWAVWDATGEAQALSSLRANGHAIRWLSPFWYTLHGNGTLSSRENDHAQVLAAARAEGVQILALVNDGSGVAGLISTASGRAAGVAAIRRMLADNPGVTGVMVDFETLPNSAGAELVSFVSALRAALPSNDTVGVAVGPKVSGNESGEGLWNYAALGRAADLVQVMTYDDHGDGTPPGAIAPTAWVRRVADYATSVIPPSKILLGVPAYGYEWSGGTSAATLTLQQAQALAARYGVTPLADPGSAELHFTAGGHTVWFESPSAVATVRDIASNLGIGGLAVWTIGGAGSGFWTALTGGAG